jgi:hypothetical protein
MSYYSKTLTSKYRVYTAPHSSITTHTLQKLGCGRNQYGHYAFIFIQLVHYRKCGITTANTYLKIKIIYILRLTDLLQHIHCKNWDVGGINMGFMPLFLSNWYINVNVVFLQQFLTSR